MDVEIIKGDVSKDHLHVLVSVTAAFGDLETGCKGQKLSEATKRISKSRQTILGRHLWARGYFVASSGNVTDDVMARYIEMQDKMEPTTMTTSR